MTWKLVFEWAGLLIVVVPLLGLLAFLLADTCFLEDQVVGAEVLDKACSTVPNDPLPSYSDLWNQNDYNSLVVREYRWWLKIDGNRVLVNVPRRQYERFSVGTKLRVRLTRGRYSGHIRLKTMDLMQGSAT